MLLSRAIMAGGGDSVKVAPHDLAIIVGAIGLIGAIVISLFATSYIPPVDFGEDQSNQEVRALSIGVLGSNDKIIIEGNPLCNANISCEINSIVLHLDGDELPNPEIITEEDGSFHTTVPVNGSGEVTIEMSGIGSWEFDISAQRQIPVQFIPAILALTMLVWGVWRKMQETTEDSDIEDVVSSN